MNIVKDNVVNLPSNKIENTKELLEKGVLTEIIRNGKLNNNGDEIIELIYGEESITLLAKGKVSIDSRTKDITQNYLSILIDGKEEEITRDSHIYEKIKVIYLQESLDSNIGITTTLRGATYMGELIGDRKKTVDKILDLKLTGS